MKSKSTEKITEEINNFHGKRLLLVGGSQMACNIVNKAHAMGLYVIVTDQFLNNPAKMIADESYMISTYDEEGLVKLCKERDIDGIITGYIDSILPYYQKVCERMGLPCYATKRQIEIATNKDIFKKVCEKYDVPVVPEYRIDLNFSQNGLETIQYPVLVKPIDNSSSRGISVCNNRTELVNACNKALQFSKKKKFIVEKYFDFPGVNIEYHLNNGEILLESMMDRRTTKSQREYISLPTAFLYPSVYLSRYLDEMNNKVINMLKSLGMKDGTLFMSAFVTEKGFFFHEMGYRLGGAMAYKYVEKCCGYSPMELLINFAISGRMTKSSIKEQVNPYYNGCLCVELIPLLKKGIIGCVRGLDNLDDINTFVDIEQKHFPGDEIKLIGTYDQILARVLLMGDLEQLNKDIDTINRRIEVLDIDGENMVLDCYRGEDLYDWYGNI